MAKLTKFMKAELELRDYAMNFPFASEHFPWDHRAIKVKAKIFLILSNDPKRFALTVKLPVTGKIALTLPFAEPTGYGLGKSGWITAEFTGDEDVPTEMFEEWIDESFAAVAPKRILAMREAGETSETLRAAPGRKSKQTEKSAKGSIKKSSKSVRKRPAKKS